MDYLSTRISHIHCLFSQVDTRLTLYALLTCVRRIKEDSYSSSSIPRSPLHLHHLHALILSPWILLCHWQLRCVHTYIHFIHSPILLYSGKDCATFILHIIAYCSVPFGYLSVLTLVHVCFNKLVLNCSPVVSSKSVFHYRWTDLKTTHQQHK